MSYAELPEFNGTNGFPKERMEEIIHKIREQWYACSFSFLTRLMPWCEYIRSLDAKAAEVVSSDMSSFTNVSAANGSLLNIGTAEKPIGSCYDDYLYIFPGAAMPLYVVTLFLTIVCFLGVVVTCASLFWIHRLSKNSAAWLYLTAASIANVFFMLAFGFIFSFRLSSPNHMVQLWVYKSWAIKLLTVGMPVLQLFNILSTYFILNLLIDRLILLVHPSTYVLISHAAKSRRISLLRTRNALFGYQCSTVRCLLYMCGLTLIFTIYTIPKCFEYTVFEGETPDVYVMRYFLQQSSTYQAVVVLILQPTVELLIPALLILGVSITICIRLNKQPKWRQGAVEPSVGTLQDVSDGLHQFSSEELCNRHTEERVISLALRLGMLTLVNLIVQAGCSLAKYVYHEDHLTITSLDCAKWSACVLAAAFLPVVFLITFRRLLGPLCRERKRHIPRNNSSFTDECKFLS